MASGHGVRLVGPISHDPRGLSAGPKAALAVACVPSQWPYCVPSLSLSSVSVDGCRSVPYLGLEVLDLLVQADNDHDDDDDK
jgi:hypothetical protein